MYNYIRNYSSHPTSASRATTHQCIQPNSGEVSDNNPHKPKPISSSRSPTFTLILPILVSVLLFVTIRLTLAQDKEIQAQNIDQNRELNQHSEEDYLNEISQYSKWDQSDPVTVTSLYSRLVSWGDYAKKNNSEKVANAILQFQILDPNLEKVRISVLGNLLNMPEMNEFIIDKLKNGNRNEQVVAARKLAENGSPWSIVRDVIEKYELYRTVKDSRYEEAIPLLKDAISNAGWESRYDAAKALESFGDSTALQYVVEDIHFNAPVDTNRSTLRAVDSAIKVAKKQNMTWCASGIARFANVDNIYVGSNSVYALMSFTHTEDSQESLSLLSEISNNCTNDRLRNQIETFLVSNPESEK